MFFFVPFGDLEEELQMLGDELKVLQISGNHPPQDVEQSQLWIGALARNGAMLYKRDIMDLYANAPLADAILSAVHGQVRCLSVGGEHTQRITAHCVRLHELHLSVLEVDAKQMWIALGPTLRFLSIVTVIPDVYKKMMRNIHDFCRKLISVEIVFEKDCWEGHVKLYLSLGAQLK